MSLLNMVRDYRPSLLTARPTYRNSKSNAEENADWSNAYFKGDGWRIVLFRKGY